jgi:hypothetical protein
MWEKGPENEVSALCQQKICGWLAGMECGLRTVAAAVLRIFSYGRSKKHAVAPQSGRAGPKQRWTRSSLPRRIFLIRSS